MSSLISVRLVSRMTVMALAFGALFTQTGCSSYFTRQSCEKTNWFEYGQKVAMSGKRLSGDQFVQECRKVEAEINEVDLDRGFKTGMAKYCTPAEVFGLGKRGESFAPEMCEENARVLTERHKAGILEYCKKSNGYAAGSSGRTYNGICPKELETAFMPEFRRGRKKYLSVLVIENEKKINDLEREALNLERERNMKSLEMQRLQIPSGFAVERQIDPVTGALREQVVQKQTDDQKRAADDMRWQVQSLDSKINGKRQEQSSLREKNREIQLEVVSLDDKNEG